MVGRSPNSDNTLTALVLGRIAIALGCRPDGSRWRARCPAHDGADRNLSLWLADDRLGLRCWSHNCSRRAILDAMINLGLLPDYRGHRGSYRPRSIPRPPPLNRPIVNRNIEFARRIWDEAVAIGDSRLAKTYFECRPGGLVVPASCTTLRFHPGCPRGRTERLPAIIALVVGALSGEFVAIHRIFLTADGRDRLRDGNGKLSLGPTIGGVVCLSPYESVGQSLVLTQSIEDGLACLADGCSPCWAAPSDAIMASFPLLRRLVEGLTIVCDNDESGLAAGRKILEHYLDADMPAVMVAPSDHKDANELWGALHAQG